MRRTSSIALCVFFGLLFLVGSGPALAQGGLHKVKHIIIVMQENHSFDNYFGALAFVPGSPYHSRDEIDHDVVELFGQIVLPQESVSSEVPQRIVRVQEVGLFVRPQPFMVKVRRDAPPRIVKCEYRMAVVVNDLRVARHPGTNGCAKGCLWFADVRPLLFKPTAAPSYDRRDGRYRYRVAQNRADAASLGAASWLSVIIEVRASQGVLAKWLQASLSTT